MKVLPPEPSVAAKEVAMALLAPADVMGAMAQQISTMTHQLNQMNAQVELLVRLVLAKTSVPALGPVDSDKKLLTEPAPIPASTLTENS